MASLTLRTFLGLLTWAGALAEILSLAGLPVNSNQSICGPWGCGPPTQALLACHVAWLVGLVPPVVLLARWRQRLKRVVRATGLIMIMFAIATMLVMLTYQRLIGWPQADPWQRQYFWHRYGFSIATAVDFPIFQSLLVGTWLRRVSARDEGISVARSVPACKLFRSNAEAETGNTELVDEHRSPKS